MESRKIDSFDVNNKNERFAIQQMKQFIESEDKSYGKILVLYGLRRTGKTTMMEQTAKFYNNFKKVITQKPKMIEYVASLCLFKAIFKAFANKTHPIKIPNDSGIKNLKSRLLIAPMKVSYIPKK